MAKDLAKALAAIDPLLDEHTRGLMRPPAKAASLKKLSKSVLGGKPLPRDLETFFLWHDGRSGVEHIHPDDNRSTMTVDEVIDAWKFLTWASLLAWAEDVAKALAKQPKKKKTAPKLALDASKTAWKKRTKAPTKAQVAKLPAGAAFYWDHVPPHPRKPLAHVFVKFGEDDWRTSRADTPAAAVAAIQKMLDAPKAPDDSFWKRDDFNIAFYAKEENYDDAVDDPKRVVVHEGTLVIRERAQ